MLHSLDEVCLIPAVDSIVSSRSTITSVYPDFSSPIFTAPMYSTVQTEESRREFRRRGINVIVPRTVDYKERLRLFNGGQWTAFSLSEAEELIQFSSIQDELKLCVDLANGHMKKCLSICRKCKELHPTWKIMIGNIANPGTYRQYAMAGADYVRVGIGSGNVCTTAVQTGMYYPMGSLLIEINFIKKELAEGGYNVPKVISDGGFKYIDQCVKALALGADYVMLGKLLAQTNVASGPTRFNLFKFRREREYFGMSTEKAQKLMNPDKPVKRSEGKVIWVPIKYTIDKWIADFNHALRSSMSYASALRLDQFIGKVEWEIMTPNAINSYVKSVD